MNTPDANTINEPFPHVPQARPAPIDDALLMKLKDYALTAQAGTLSHEAGELLLYCLPAIIEEVIQRRAVMSVIEVVMNAENVVTLPPQRA